MQPGDTNCSMNLMHFAVLVAYVRLVTFLHLKYKKALLHQCSQKDCLS